jgi:hypothetical protein
LRPARGELRNDADLDFLLDLLRDDDVQDVAQDSIETHWGHAAVDALVARLSGCTTDCLS